MQLGTPPKSVPKNHNHTFRFYWNWREDIKLNSRYCPNKKIQDETLHKFRGELKDHQKIKWKQNLACKKKNDQGYINSSAVACVYRAIKLLDNTVVITCWRKLSCKIFFNRVRKNTILRIILHTYKSYT